LIKTNYENTICMCLFVNVGIFGIIKKS